MQGATLSIASGTDGTRFIIQPMVQEVMLEKSNEGEIYEVTVESIGSYGDGRATIDQTPVYIPNLEPEEVRDVVITDIRGDVASASALPENPDLPFFAYGIFRRDELGYRRIRECVSESGNQAEERQHVEGRLIIDDGMPILVGGDFKIEGHVMHFIESASMDAYAEIASAEPMSHYEWVRIETLDGEAVNTLQINSSVDYEPGVIERKAYHGTQWSTRSYFKKGLFVVQETFEQNKQLRDQFEFFRLQMGYLLVWSLIERYVSLRWGHSGQENYEARNRFASNDRKFQQGLEKVFDDGHASEYRTLYQSRDPSGSAPQSMNPSNPESIVRYLYQIRNNITHQGKGELTADGELLCRAIQDLYQIFRITLSEQYSDADFATIEPVNFNS